MMFFSRLTAPGLRNAYSPELYKTKCAAVFEHIYESYPERNAGVYA
jgi:type I restriction enzyme R subunit